MIEDTDMTDRGFQRVLYNYEDARDTGMGLLKLLKGMGLKVVDEQDSGNEYQVYMERFVRNRTLVLVRDENARAIATLSEVRDPRTRDLSHAVCSLELDYEKTLENVRDFGMIGFDLYDELEMN